VPCAGPTTQQVLGLGAFESGGGHQPHGRAVAAPAASGRGRSEQADAKRTTDNRTWDGDAWVEERTWLPTEGTTTWRTTTVPSGEDLLPGGYAVRVRVTDRAGRAATGPATTFTMAYSGRLSVVHLEPAPGREGYTSGVDLDDRGVVVGASSEDSPTQWVNGTPTLLQLPSGLTEVVPTAIAPDGSIAGHTTGSGPRRAVRWDPSGTPHVLPAPAGGEGLVTRDISAAGVVGSAGQQPVWWPQDDRVVLLAMRPGDVQGSADGIDDHGTIVGHVVDAEGVSHVATWTDEGRTLSLLGTLGGVGGRATAINEVGQVVGVAATEDGAQRPFVADLWSGGALTEVYVPSDGPAVPHDIADDGTVVGEYEVGGVTRGFAVVDGEFRSATSMLPAGTGWDVRRFYAVNDLGQLSGFGLDGTRYGGFLATTPHAPVAEDAVVDTDAGTPVPVTLTARDPDPGTTLTREVVVGPAHGTLGAVDGDRVTYTPDAGFSGTDVFSWRSHDGTLGSNAATVTVRVRPGADTNQRPVAVVTAPTTVPEGGVVVLDGSGSHDADGTVTAYAWDLDDDGEHDDATGASVELPVPREGVRAVSLRVTDDGGATGTATTSVTVVNVAPLVTLPPTAVVDAGEPLRLTGSFTDPGDDTWTATVDTGAGARPLVLEGRGFRVEDVLDQPGDHRVEVRVCDGADCGSATTTVTVREPLRARISGPDAAQEGDRVTLDASGSTGSPAAYAWDLDGDGVHDDASGATATVTVRQDGERTVGLRVSDDRGRESTTVHVVAVANVLPEVTVPSTASAVVGTAWTVDGSFTDPGDDSWTVTADLGAGPQAVAPTERSFRVEHTFTTPGTRSVPVTVCDDDGCGRATVVVEVTEAPAAWPWRGFLAPVDNLPVVNAVKAGQAIPMKLSVGGDRGPDILAAGSPVSVRHGCDTSGGTDEIESTVTAGASQLTYDAGTGTYQYVWKTQRAWAGQCRTFRMTLDDGSVHEAELRFR
jgi:hypothetical protein